jgi:hypothetical protein
MSAEPQREGQSDAVAAAALPGSFEWGGKTYKVSPITLDIEARFSQLLIDQTYKALTLARPAMGEAVFRDAMRQANEDVASYAYEYSGKIARRALESLLGQQELAYLCLVAYHPEITRAFMRPIYANKEAWEQLGSQLRHVTAIPPNGQGPPQERAAS